MKRSEFWNHLLNSGKNAGRPAKRKEISVFVGTAFIAIIAITALLLTTCSEATSEDPVKHTVSYDVNGGEGAPDPATQTVNHGETIASAPTGISRPGFTLSNAWNTKADGSGDSFLFGNEGTAVRSDITLYAQWANQQHTVSYDANGGEGTPDPATQTVNHNDIIPTAPTGISRPGFTLSNAWNTKADGSGDAFLFGNGGTAVRSDITLYAQWANQQHTVSYDANGGEGTPDPATQTVNHNDIIPTAPTGISRPGFTLSNAWNTKADGSGDSFLFGNGGTAVRSDIDLYAQWTIKQYEVSYDVNGGEGTAPSVETVNHGSTANEPSRPTRTGHEFTGWFDAASGGTQFDFGTAVTSDITLYAQWTIKQYEVSYDVNGGESTAPSVETVDHGSAANEPSRPTRSGYEFTGWFDAASGGTQFDFGTVVTSDITLYAQWTIKQYEVSYDVNGGESTAPSVETVDHGSAANEPSRPTRSGYEFTGWFDAASGGTQFDFGTVVTSDITLYAQWTIKQYEVSYDVNGGDSTAPSVETVDHGSAAVKPADPTRSGYAFTGWFDAASGGAQFDFGTAVTSDIILYAQWTIKQYEVSYDVNGGESAAPSVETVDHGSAAVKPTDPTRSGHTFTGWFDAASGGAQFDFGTAVTSDITLYAQWTIKQYTVSYDVNEGEGTPDPATQTVNHGETIASAPTGISRPGFTLSTAWNTKVDGSGNSFLFGNEGTAVTSDIILYAQWTIKQYEVSYDVNGGESAAPSVETVNHGSTAVKPADPTRSGHTFTGWFDAASGGAQFDFGTGVTSDITLYAQWTIKQYTVSYDVNGGKSAVPSVETVDHGSTAVKPADPTRSGHEFTGWFDAALGGVQFDFGTGVTSDIILYAQWTIKQYEVSYDVNGGESAAPSVETVNHGSTAVKPTDPTRSGHMFTGWFAAASGGVQFDFGTAVTSDITLYAQWTIKQYEVSYNVNGGKSAVPSVETVDHGSTAVKPADPTRSGHEFTGWFDAALGGVQFDFGTGVTSDITLYAQWTIKQYEVSYNVNGGESAAPSGETVNHGSTAVKPADPTRSGHMFTGWFDAASGGVQFDFGTGVTSDITLYAQWTIKQYEVSYNVNGGKSAVPSVETVDHGSTAVKPADPTRSGHEFTGWFDASLGGVQFDFGTGVTSDITLYAQWTIKQYEVSYNVNGGESTVPSGETVNHGSTAVKPADPTRSGHMFTGWFDAASGGVQFDFGTGVTSDITLYAQWTIKQYEVSYNVNGGESAVPSVETVDHGSTAVKPADPTRSGHTFTGWFDASLGGVQFDFGAGVTSDITLYAQWIIKQHTVTFDSNSGSSVTSQQVAPGAYAAEPEAPTRSGYVFDGWFSDSGLSVAWTFANDAVNSDITLYARWMISTILVQGGTFDMGSADSDAYADEAPVRSVTVNSFYMAKTELTFEQYDAYCDDQGITKPGDSGYGRGTRPVINVSWYDAVKYSNWLSEQAGLTKAYTISGTSVTWDDTATGYRLPTEAEWEYAARGGDQSQGYKYSGSDTVDEVGWYLDNAGGQTQPVGQKQANELGLYDMSGNVWEWSWDWYGAYSSESQTDPIGPTTGSSRVLRGGSWNFGTVSQRSANRGSHSPGGNGDKYGFRLARPAD